VSIITTVGTEQFTTDLSVEITGSYLITLSTPDQNLAVRGPAGSPTDETFTIENTGTAPVTNVALSATPPGSWTVTFDPKTVDSIPAGQSVKVKGTITPTGNAIAGDYDISFKATGKEANDSADIRFTVETSILGAILGAAVIVAAVGGLYWVFRRYGRR
jgi:uncharacterized membrane protein